MSTYDQDVIKWSEEQAKYLLAGDFSHLDLKNLAEEILDVGKAEVRELESRLEVLIAHLLKWAYQPERRGSSWKVTIDTQRKAIERRFKRTPSLKHKLHDEEWAIWEGAWDDGIILAMRETNLERDVFPAEMPWTEEQVFNKDWYPEVAH